MSERLLLDTHVFAWYTFSPKYIPNQTLERISDSDSQVFVSSISAWEISLKFKLGRWQEVKPLVKNFKKRLAAYQFEALAVSIEHGLLAGNLNINHRDPFDRLLIAQAITENCVLITKDEAIHGLKPRPRNLKLLW